MTTNKHVHPGLYFTDGAVRPVFGTQRNHKVKWHRLNMALRSWGVPIASSGLGITHYSDEEEE